MIVLRREKRVRVTAFVILCGGLLYFWILSNIQSMDGPSPAPPTNNEEIEVSNILDGSGLTADGERELSESTVDLEGLAKRREHLETSKQEFRNQRERLSSRLKTLTTSLEDTRANEKAMQDAWRALDEQARNGTGVTETMAEDFLAIRDRRLSLVPSAETLTDRQNLLEELLRNIGGQEVGTRLAGISGVIAELEASVDSYTRECREITRQSQRLDQRLQSSTRGEPIDDVLRRMDAVGSAPDLGRLADERESEITEECDAHFTQMVVQIRRDAETRAKQRRTKNEEQAKAIRQKADVALAAHESEQERLDAEVAAKRRTVEFDRDRAQLEHYLVPFIALKRTYTTPAVLDDETKEFHWVNVPLEQAASLADIEATGAFESGGDSFQRLERFTRSRIEMLDDRYLPFGQHWSYRDEGYLVVARELLMKHGQAMVEAGLLRP